MSDGDSFVGVGISAVVLVEDSPGFTVAHINAMDTDCSCGVSL